MLQRQQSDKPCMRELKTSRDCCADLNADFFTSGILTATLKTSLLGNIGLVPQHLAVYAGACPYLCYYDNQYISGYKLRAGWCLRAV